MSLCPYVSALRGVRIAGLMLLLGCEAGGAATAAPVRFSATVYGEGEAAGFLKVIPRGMPLSEWSHRDVIIVEDAPLDLSIVSALISAGPQSGGSHLSLRLGEKGIPSASVPEVYSWKDLMAWNGRLVRLVADHDTVELSLTTLEEAERLWTRQRPQVGDLALDLTRQDWASFADLRHPDAPAFGAKAANLGELHRTLPPENRVAGFAIPVSTYEDFVKHGDLEVSVNSFLNDDRVRHEPSWKKQRLRELRQRIGSAPMPDGLLARLVERSNALFGDAASTTRLRFRSSTNAEDLAVFSGAGLYESKSGCLADDLDTDDVGPSHCLTEELRTYWESERARWIERKTREPGLAWIADIVADIDSELVNEKSATAALRKVWASLWNERAYDEREYYGIDHRRTKMAVAVQLSEKQEKLEAVAFTNVRYREAPPINVLISQLGEIGVVRPVDPTAFPETRLFWRGADGQLSLDALQSSSSLVAQGESLWSDERMRALAALLFSIQDHFQTHVYPSLPDLALDIELKITHDDRLLIKQARPYLSKLLPL